MKKPKHNKKGQNYLDYIPVPDAKIRYEIRDGKVTVFRDNKGIMNRIFQVLLKKPKVTQVHLDETGNFIWPLMDGNRSIYDIAEKVKEEFGDKAEPLYPRIVRYFQMLKDYGFVAYKGEAHE